MSNLKSIYSEGKCRYSFLLLPHTTHTWKEIFWENYFNIAILVIEALLPRQDSERGSTFLGLGGEGSSVFNFAECLVNWEKGNVNRNKERSQGKVLGCDGNSHEQGMLQEPGNAGPVWGGKWGTKVPDLQWEEGKGDSVPAVGGQNSRVWALVSEEEQDKNEVFVQLGEE